MENLKFDEKLYYNENKERIKGRIMANYWKKRIGKRKRYKIVFKYKFAPEFDSGYIYKSLNDMSKKLDYSYSKINRIFKKGDPSGVIFIKMELY